MCLLFCFVLFWILCCVVCEKNENKKLLITKKRAVTCVIRCSALVSLGLFEITFEMTHYFLEKTMKLTQDTYAHYKGCLECPKNINN